MSEFRAQLNLTDDNALKPQLKMQIAALENAAGRRSAKTKWARLSDGIGEIFENISNDCMRDAYGCGWLRL